MEIRPAEFGENLNEWFRLLGRRWKPLLVTSLVAYVPLAVAIVLLFTFTGASQLFLDLTSDPDLIESSTWSQVIDEFMPLLWAGVVWLVLQTIATVFVYLAASRTVALDRAGHEGHWRSIVTHARSRLISALVAGLLVAVAFSLVVMLLVAVGWALIDMMGTSFFSVFVTTVLGLTGIVVMVWVGLSVALYSQVLAMEEEGASGSLRRSFELVHDRWWPTFGFVLVTSLIASAVSQVASIALTPLIVIGVLAPDVIGLVYGLATLLQAPFVAAMAAGLAIWYIDLRSRKEALVGEQLM